MEIKKTRGGDGFEFLSVFSMTIATHQLNSLGCGSNSGGPSVIKFDSWVSPSHLPPAPSAFPLYPLVHYAIGIDSNGFPSVILKKRLYPASDFENIVYI
jgi:hypothetical protein